MAISITIARLLGVELFGTYAIVVSTQNIVLVCSEFGIPLAIAKFISEYRAKDSVSSHVIARAGFKIVLIVTALSVIAYLLLGDLIGNGIYQEPLIATLIPLSGLVVISTTMIILLQGIAQGHQMIRVIALIRIANPAINLGFIPILAIYYSISGILVAIFIGQMIIVMFLLARFRKKFFSISKVSVQPNRAEINKKLLSYSMYQLVGGLLIVPVLWLGNTELTIVSGLESLGYFAVAFALYSAMMVIPQSIIIPLMPRISQLSVISASSIRKSIADTIRYASLLLFVVVFSVTMFSTIIVEILYGSSYSSASSTLSLMAIAAFFYALTSIAATLYTGTGRMRSYLILNVIGSLSFVIIAFIGIPLLGVEGLGLTYALTYSSSFVLYLTFSKYQFKMTYPETILPILVATIFIITGFAAIFVLEVGLIGEIAIYACGMITMALLMRKDMMSLLKGLAALLFKHRLRTL